MDSAAYEEEILERIVIPLFSDIHHENETSVRTSVGKLLLDFVSHCDTKRSLELLDVVEKLFNRSFEKYADEGKNILKNGNESAHITTMVDELISVSSQKLAVGHGLHKTIVCDVLSTGVYIEIVPFAGIARDQNIPNIDRPFGEILLQNGVDGVLGDHSQEDFRVDAESARQCDVQHWLSR